MFKTLKDKLKQAAEQKIKEASATLGNKVKQKIDQTIGGSPNKAPTQPVAKTNKTVAKTNKPAETIKTNETIKTAQTNKTAQPPQTTKTMIWGSPPPPPKPSPTGAGGYSISNKESRDEEFRQQGINIYKGELKNPSSVWKVKGTKRVLNKDGVYVDKVIFDPGVDEFGNSTD